MRKIATRLVFTSLAFTLLLFSNSYAETAFYGNPNNAYYNNHNTDTSNNYVNPGQQYNYKVKQPSIVNPYVVPQQVPQQAPQVQDVQQGVQQQATEQRYYTDKFGRKFKIVSQEPTPIPTQVPATGAKVAILLPLTGAASKTGNMLLDAAKLAITDLDGEKLELMAFDTKSSEAGAREAATKAVENGVQIILGPLYSNAVSAIKPIAQQAGINIISFSNNIEVAGQGAYLLGIMPDAQVRSIVEYAKEQGISNISAILPDDKFGQVANRVLEEMYSNGEIELGAIEIYKAQHPIFGTTVKKFRRKLNENGIRPSKKENALLFIESGARLKKTVNAMDLYGLKVANKFTLLGSYLWNNPETKQIANINGGYYIDLPGKTREDFNFKFDSQFGYMPSNIASLGYDAVALVISLSKQGSFDEYSITNNAGFIGNNGFFKILPTGTSKRDLEISKITAGSSKVVSNVSAKEATPYYANYFDENTQQQPNYGYGYNNVGYKSPQARPMPQQGYNYNGGIVAQPQQQYNYQPSRRKWR